MEIESPATASRYLFAGTQSVSGSFYTPSCSNGLVNAEGGGGLVYGEGGGLVYGEGGGLVYGEGGGLVW